MPARRSRTERWRESLDKLVARGGPIEISVDTGETGKSLVWRVRLLAVSDTELIVEQPVALRRPIPIEVGSELIGGLSIGQNRWMFHTRVLDAVDHPGHAGAQRALKLLMPASVERCQRRNFYRTSTTSLDLPPIRVWSLNDPASAVPMEIATRASILNASGDEQAEDPIGVALPDVGIGFAAVLLNIGGGGAGLLVSPENASALDRPGAFWLRLDLTPTVPVPLSLTARLAHTRVDSSQNVHTGFAFDFSLNREYETFIAEQICRYVARLQDGGASGRRVA